MLNNQGFDLWADNYDASVGVSDEEGTYPFAGYKEVLNIIFNRVLTHPGKTVLDIGFGTATLTAKLYENGCTVYGQDFSRKMIELAQKKMPEAALFQGDFSQGLVSELTRNRYDSILATYSLHHLSDPVEVLLEVRRILAPGGRLFVADFLRHDDETMRSRYGDRWLGFDEEQLTGGLRRAGFSLLSCTRQPVGRGLSLLLLVAGCAGDASTLL